MTQRRWRGLTGEKGRRRARGRGRRIVVRVPQLDRLHARAVWREATRALKDRQATGMVLDLSAVPRIDGAGVALVRALEDRCRRRGVEFSLGGTTPDVARFLDFVGERSPAGRPHAARALPGARELLARKVTTLGRGLGAAFEVVGRFAASAAYLATHPREVRGRDVIHQVQRSGAEGMWLLGFLSVLLGIIIAFEGLGGARGFGSPVLVADVVTLATTREMAPLLTGLIVTGRSGAAIAAEIGTMKIDQELDALSVMGFDVVRFLFVPRVLALVIATPLLTLLSIGAGIIGGCTVAVFVLHVGPTNYFTEVRSVLSMSQLASALTKGATFGLATGVVACFQGMQAGKAAEDVGKRTTAAVVTGFLLVILADAFFSIVSEVYS